MNITANRTLTLNLCDQQQPPAFVRAGNAAACIPAARVARGQHGFASVSVLVRRKYMQIRSALIYIECDFILP